MSVNVRKSSLTCVYGRKEEKQGVGRGKEKQRGPTRFGCCAKRKKEQPLGLIGWPILGQALRHVVGFEQQPGSTTGGPGLGQT